MRRCDYNLFWSDDSRCWVLEIRAIGNDWYVYGMYGSKKAALEVVKKRG